MVVTQVLVKEKGEIISFSTFIGPTFSQNIVSED
jgi:hypothetical protein